MSTMRKQKREGLCHTLWWELGIGGSILRSACSLSLCQHFPLAYKSLYL
ncbi:MAG: hypothetical protein Q9M28_10485 [Mariprofundaceae bacterium]|nr:hypothetical protein [Mariprofundaceae bacterium]